MRSRFYLCLFSLYDVYIVGLMAYILIFSKVEMNLYIIFKTLFLILIGMLFIKCGIDYKKKYENDYRYLFNLNSLIRIFSTVYIISACPDLFGYIIDGSGKGLLGIMCLLLCGSLILRTVNEDFMSLFQIELKK